MATEVAPRKRDWQDLVADKRRECQQQIPHEWTLGDDLLALPLRLLDFDLPRRSGILSELELDITESYTAAQLLVKLASGQVSSLAVTMAFCKRAAIAQQAVSTGAGIMRRYSLTPVVYRRPASQKHSSCRPLIVPAF